VDNIGEQPIEVIIHDSSMLPA